MDIVCNEEVSIIRRNEAFPVKKILRALNVTAKEIQLFLEDQAVFVKAAVQELREGSLSQMIKEYYVKAYFLYIDHYKQALI